jgi:CheY-like chemotaxis protein
MSLSVRTPGAGQNTLLVEDNAINMEVARKMLEHLGFTCQAAKDGQEAVDAVQERCCDPVLMECQMPGVDGNEATRLAAMIARWLLVARGEGSGKAVRSKQATSLNSARTPSVAA